MDQVDSLEGWVAVKSNPFVDDLLPPRLTFLVAWNGVESKIAVTCRSSSRTVSDKNDDKTRFGYFSYQELKGIHEMLCLIHPSLSPCLPALPEQPVGIMAYISSVPVPEDVEKLCQDLTDYFNLALEVCKEKLLISTLFEDPNYDDYFESVGELRRQGYLEQITNSEEEIKNVIFERDNCVTMQEMENVYDVEDDAVFRLNVVLAEYFNYQIQPFLDLREVAFNKLKEAKDNLLNPDLGERVRKENVEAIAEWQEHYEQSLDSIQDIYIKYYTKTSQIYTDMCDRMNEDKTRFGKKAFDIVGTDRLFRIEENMCLEKMQLFLNSKKWCVQERDKVKQEIASLDESPAVRKEVELLENHVYRWQIRIYDEHLKIFSEEHKLNKSLLRARHHQIDEVNDEVMFYDAVEDLDEVSDEDDVDECSLSLKTDPEILKLKRKLADINRRRAIVRNKKSTLERQCKEKQEEKRNYVDTYNQHHSIQMKRDKDKEIIEMKKDFIQEQRKKTIERLKSHKVKYPTPPTIKPLRYQPPSLRRDSLTSLSRRNPPSLSSNRSNALNNEYPSLHPIKEKKDKKTPVKRKPFVRPQKKKQDNVDGDVTFYISGGTVMNQQEVSAHDDGSGMTGDSGTTQVTSAPSNVPPPPVNIPPPPPLNIPPPPPINIPPPPAMPSLSNSKPTSNAPKPPPLGLGNLAEALKSLKKADTTMETTKTGSGGLDLSSIAAGRIHLKPASQRTLKPVKKDPNDLNEIFNMIKQGVKLRPVKSIDQSENPSMSQSFPSDTHISLLQESMRRINNMVRGNSPESETSDDNSDFDD